MGGSTIDQQVIPRKGTVQGESPPDTHPSGTAFPEKEDLDCVLHHRRGFDLLGDKRHNFLAD